MFNWLKKLFSKPEATMPIKEENKFLEKPCRTCGKPIFYEADERGELPPDLKRGVLSQDGLYDLLEEKA